MITLAALLLIISVLITAARLIISFLHFELSSNRSQSRMNTQENNFLTRVADMEGSLASQDLALRDSVPLTEYRAQDAAAEHRIHALRDELRVQLDSVAGRVALAEDRLAAHDVALDVCSARVADGSQRTAAQEEELSSTKGRVSFLEERTATLEAEGRGTKEAVAKCATELGAAAVKATESERQAREHADKALTQSEARWTASQAQLTAAVASNHAAQSTALKAAVKELTKAMEDRNTGVRELILQIAEHVAALQEETAQQYTALEAKIAETERCLGATDNLLADSMNDVHQKIAYTTDIAAVRLTAEEGRALVDELRTQLDSQIQLLLQEAAASTKAALTSDAARRQVEVEGHVNAAVTQVTAQCAQLESALAQQAQQAERSEEQVQAAVADLRQELAAVNARVTGASVEQQTAMSAVEASLLTKLTDANALVQLQEQRVMQVLQQSMQERVSQVTHAMGQEMAAVETRFDTLSAALGEEVRSSKENVNTLTLQLLALQAQLNDQSEEALVALEDQSKALKQQVQTVTDKLAAEIAALERVQEERQQAVYKAQQRQLESIEGLTSANQTLSAKHTAAMEKLTADTTAAENSAKQRLAGLESRLVRQEAQQRDKAVATERHGAALLEQATSLAAVTTRLIALEADRSDFNAVREQMGEIEELMEAHSEQAARRIQELQSFITSQIQTMASVAANSALTAAASAPSQSSPARQSSRKASSNKNKAYPTILLPVHQLSASVSASASASAVPAELLHSPMADVRPAKSAGTTSASSRNSSSSNIQRNAPSSIMRREVEAEAEAEEAELESATMQYSDDQFEEEEDQGQGQEQTQREEEYESGSEAGADEDEDSLKQFNSIINSVNSEIATLGVHLQSYTPAENEG
jgi:hypothetical protein